MKLLKKFDQFINENSDNIDHDAQHQTENYMFFGNLKTIKRLCETLLEMDQSAVDHILKNGHSWAVDHIATSKDDVEEVFNFIKNEINEPVEDAADDIEHYTVSKYSEDELDQMTRDQIEHDEMMLRREQGI
jgi:histidinol dehydrogenase